MNSSEILPYYHDLVDKHENNTIIYTIEKVLELLNDTKELYNLMKITEDSVKKLDNYYYSGHGMYIEGIHYFIKRLEILLKQYFSKLDSDYYDKPDINKDFKLFVNVYIPLIRENLIEYFCHFCCQGKHMIVKDLTQITKIIGKILKERYIITPAIIKLFDNPDIIDRLEKCGLEI